MDEIEIVRLSQRFNEVFFNVERDKWGYCHKTSVGNFIFHLPKIKGKSEKKEIVVLINRYLDRIEGVGMEADMSFSESLFNDYLNYISNKFQYRVGFVVILPLKALVTLIPILVLTYCFVITNVYVLCIVSFCLVAYLFLLLIKLRKRKVYGFGY